MKVNGKNFRTIWVHPDDPAIIRIIDQRHLPFEFVVEDLRTVDDVVRAIADMHVRGAGLIGAAAAYGIYLATLEAPEDARFADYLFQSAERLLAARPTAVNLAWAVKKQLDRLEKVEGIEAKRKTGLLSAGEIADFDAQCCREIGQKGVKLIEAISARKPGQPVNILTHCNAGWLAFVDFGSALAPVYAAHNKGIDVHVWVDETRPRNQGARLTAWELNQQGIAHTLIADNTGGHLMQHGLVDIVLVGSDRTTKNGDVANKIGTYLKALAAHDNGVPFYAAMPSSTIDWDIVDGVKEIPIEERNGEEVKFIEGLNMENGQVSRVLLSQEKTSAINFAFDVTPARLVTGIITERGICEASAAGLLKLFAEYA